MGSCVTILRQSEHDLPVCNLPQLSCHNVSPDTLAAVVGHPKIFKRWLLLRSLPLHPQHAEAGHSSSYTFLRSVCSSFIVGDINANRAGHSSGFFFWNGLWRLRILSGRQYLQWHQGWVSVGYAIRLKYLLSSLHKSPILTRL